MREAAYHAGAAVKTCNVKRPYHDDHAMVAEPDIDLVSVVVKASNHHNQGRARNRAMFTSGALQQRSTARWWDRHEERAVRLR